MPSEYSFEVFPTHLHRYITTCVFTAIDLPFEATDI